MTLVSSIHSLKCNIIFTVYYFSLSFERVPILHSWIVSLTWWISKIYKNYSPKLLHVTPLVIILENNINNPKGSEPLLKYLCMYCFTTKSILPLYLQTNLHKWSGPFPLCTKKWETDLLVIQLGSHEQMMRIN